MKLRRAVGLLAASLGAVGVANRVLEARADVLEPPLSGSRRTRRWRGIDVAYTEGGDPDAPTLVLLHGINAAGSSGEFRAVFDALAKSYHVVAPDLPGFGCSDRPPLRYSARFYEAFVADFLAAYDRPAVVASSLTGAYAVAAAREVELASLVLVCPTTTAGPTPPLTWLRELLRSPLVGATLFNLVVSKPSIRYFNADHGYDDRSLPGEAWTTYEWRTAHQPNARFAPASFISGHLNADVDLAETLRSLSAPVTLVWGREADIVPLADGRTLADDADVRLVVFDDTKLLPHVEFPDGFVETVRTAVA